MTLIQSSSPGRHTTSHSVGRNYQSLFVMLIVSVFLLGGIGSRLAYLQIIQGEQNRQLAENNRIRLIPKPPVRGNIFDRKGKILASSRLSHSVFLWPIALKPNEWPQTLKRLSETLDIPQEEIQKRVEREGFNSPSLIRIARSISPAQITALEEYSDQLEGVEVDIEAVRNYPNGDLAAHVLGYTIGRGIGGETLIDWTRKYGFGQKTGIELAPEEAAGLVADDAWKRKQFNWEWTVGDTVNMSIGQGFLQATPLQVAVMFSVPANGGDRIKPHLLKDNEESRKWRKSLDIKPETVQVLRQGLRQVVSGGTGKAMDVPTLPPTSGKSGTAEAPPGLSHAWFGAYAPADKPEIVVVAFAEHSGGGGGKVAAPMVRQVMESYFKPKKPAEATKAKQKTP